MKIRLPISNPASYQSTALFWGGRLCVLPWLGVRPALTTPALKLGYALLLIECATYAMGYGWLALRPA